MAGIPGFFRRHRLLIQAVLLYILLVALVALATRYFAWFRQGIDLARDGAAGSSGGSGAKSLQGFEQWVGSPPSEGINTFLISMASMAMAFFLTLPVVGIFTATRQKKGYRQAMVQTLAIMPVVVAGTVVLVQESLALAFALGGIVGAVSFRNRLEDPKDAVYVFCAISIGLACGVQVFAVAFAISLFFNAVILFLYFSDFGRTPAELGGTVGERRIERARSLAGEQRKGGEFISVLDQQVLQSMTPDQLAALAERALSKSAKLSKEYAVGEEARYDGSLLLVVPTSEIEKVRAAVDGVLFRDAKEWRFDRADPAEGGFSTVVYQVKCRKKAPPPLLLESVRRATLAYTDQVVWE